MGDPAVDEDLEARWRELAAEVLSSFWAWRDGHPSASLTEIEDALDERWARARARVVEDAAVTSAVAQAPGWAARPCCPTCGGAMQADGTEARHLTTTGDQVLTLRRARARCLACGAGLFPPG